MQTLYAQVHETVYEHPKTTECLKILRTDRMKLVGHLSLFWNWALKNAPSGDLGKLKARHISDAARWTSIDDFTDESDEKAERFVNALVACADEPGGSGFLDRAADGTLSIHNWHLYGGKVDEGSKRNAFHQFLKRNRDKGINIPSGDDTFELYKTDKDALVEAYRNGSKPQSGSRKTDSKPDVSTRKEGVSLTSAYKEDKTETEQRTEQNREERSVEEQQQNREESTGGETGADLAEPQSAPTHHAAAVSFASQGDSVSAVQPALSLAELAERLNRDLGINLSKAKDLAKRKPEECLRQLNYYPHFTGNYRKGKGAFWTDAIEEGYDPPKSFLEWQKKQEEEAAKAAARNAQDARRTAQDAKDAIYAARLAEIQTQPELWESIQREAIGAIPPFLAEKDKNDPLVMGFLKNQVQRIITERHMGEVQ